MQVATKHQRERSSRFVRSALDKTQNDRAFCSPTMGSEVFESTVHSFSSLISDKTIAIGGQLCIAIAGELVVDIATGETLGRELQVDDLHSGFCITKPLQGLALGILIDQGLCDLRQVVRSSLHPKISQGVTVASLLNHSAGLIEPLAVSWRLCPPDARWQLLQSSSRSEGPGYSEIAAGLIIEDLIESATTQSAAAFIEEEILDPLGLTDTVIVSETRASTPDVRRRTTVPFAISAEGCVPLLSERLACQIAELRPAFGSLVSAQGLCRLYAAVERVFQGKSVDGLPSRETLRALLSAVSFHDDKVLKRKCAFSGGFMVNLSEHHFSNRISHDAFGHTAGITQCAAFCDPRRELAAAFYLNGSTLTDPDGAHDIRRDIIDSLLMDVDHVA